MHSITDNSDDNHCSSVKFTVQYTDEPKEFTAQSANPITRKQSTTIPRSIRVNRAIPLSSQNKGPLKYQFRAIFLTAAQKLSPQLFLATLTRPSWLDASCHSVYTYMYKAIIFLLSFLRRRSLIDAVAAERKVSGPAS